MRADLNSILSARTYNVGSQTPGVDKEKIILALLRNNLIRQGPGTSMVELNVSRSDDKTRARYNTIQAICDEFGLEDWDIATAILDSILEPNVNAGNQSARNVNVGSQTPGVDKEKIILALLRKNLIMSIPIKDDFQFKLNADSSDDDILRSEAIQEICDQLRTDDWDEATVVLDSILKPNVNAGNQSGGATSQQSEKIILTLFQSGLITRAMLATGFNSKELQNLEALRNLILAKKVNVVDAAGFSEQQIASIKALECFITTDKVGVMDAAGFSEQQIASIKALECFITTDKIGVMEAAGFSTYQVKEFKKSVSPSLADPLIEDFIKDGTFTIEEVLAFSEQEIRNLTHPLINDLLKKRQLAPLEAARLPEFVLERLNKYGGIQHLLRRGRISGVQALNLARVLESPWYHLIESYLEKGKVTVDRLLKFSSDELEFIAHPNCHKAIINGILEFDEALKLTIQQIKILIDPVIQNFIKDQKLTKEEAKKLSPQGVEELKTKAFEAIQQESHIMNLIEAKILTRDEAITLSEKEIATLKDPRVYGLVFDKTLSIYKAITISEKEIAILTIPKIRSLVRDQIIRLRDVKNLSEKQIASLNDPEIYDLIRNRKLHISRVLEISPEQLASLKKSSGLSESK